MAEDPARGSGRGEDPARREAPEGAQRGFASGGPLDQAWPGPGLVRVLDEASGPRRRCQGASEDEAFGMLGRWEAAEAWCAAGKLGVIRALTGRRMPPGAGFSSADAEGLVQEVSNQLGVSARAAGALIGLAEDLATRLVLTGAALEAGVISLAKARIIAEATAVLNDERAAVAETLIAGDLGGKTPGQVAAMIGRAVVTVDPEGARKRRERAQREDARVGFWREHAGTAALAGFGLPPDEALAANQHIQDTTLPPGTAAAPGSPSPPAMTAGHPKTAGTAPGTCTSPGRTTPSPSSRSRSTSATTGMSRPGTGPAPCSATWFRSATGSAPSPPASAPPATATSNTPSPGTKAGRRAAATAAAAAAATTGSSNHPAGPSLSQGRATTSGPPPPAAPTPANR
jgi:Domain of unknown function (DUF222)